MTDKELTLLAANAAGVLPKDTEDCYDCWEETPVLIHSGWNPLCNDDQAFRLAIKLRIHLEFDENCCIPSTDMSAYRSVKFGDDAYAATRRAIVQTAAEIGKKIS